MLGLILECPKDSLHGYCHGALEEGARNIAFTGSDDILILNTDCNLFSSVSSHLQYCCLFVMLLNVSGCVISVHVHLCIHAPGEVFSQ